MTLPLPTPEDLMWVCVIMMEELHLMCVVKITSTSHIKGSREFCHTMPLHKSLDHILSFRCTIGWSYWNWDLLLIFWPMKVQAWSWINVRSIKKDTKCSSITLLRLVSVFKERMLQHWLCEFIGWTIERRCNFCCSQEWLYNTHYYFTRLNPTKKGPF